MESRPERRAEELLRSIQISAAFLGGKRLLFSGKVRSKARLSFGVRVGEKKLL